jgi:hypothetical protein
MFWVMADPGMGKSAFAASLVEYLRPRQQLLGCFFCKYGQKSRSKAEAILTSIAYQIAESFPETRESILAASSQLGVPGKTLQDKVSLLIGRPL